MSNLQKKIATLLVLMPVVGAITFFLQLSYLPAILFGLLAGISSAVVTIHLFRDHG